MVPSDLRKSNLLVDDTLLVRGKLVADDSEFRNITMHSGTLQFQHVETQTLNANELIVSGTSTSTSSTTTPTNANLLFIDNPASIVAGHIPEFVANGSAEVKSVPKSSIISSTLSYFFGDGSDGNVTISGGTTTLTRDMYYDTLTIDPTGVLIPAGYVIFCKTACVNNGLIHMNGVDGANGVGAVGGAGGTSATSTGGLVSGQTGGVGANSTLSAAPISVNNTLLGGQGGAGGNNGPRFGAGSKFFTNYVNKQTFLENIACLPFLFRVNTPVGILLGGIPGGGGGGGAGSATGGGGGGGAGGGWIMVIAREISGIGRFESKGGNGGAGVASAGRGGGGGGGVVYFISVSNQISLLQIIVTPGIGSTLNFPTEALNGEPGVYQNHILVS